jgi:hypothetical protein
MLHACSYTICLVFCYTSWCFYAFSGTNLLTRRHSASSLFSAIFVFQKSYIGNILRMDEIKAEPPIFTEASQRPKMTRRGARGQPHHQGARPSPWPCPPMVRMPWSTPDDAPLPIKSSRWEKHKNPINFPETHHDPPPSSTRDREGLEALPGTLPERGIATGGFFIVMLASGAMSE